jgi:hypothetical protein
MLEHIRPVTDGNRRIGRLLVPILIRRQGPTNTACTFIGGVVIENASLCESLKNAHITGRRQATRGKINGTGRFCRVHKLTSNSTNKSLPPNYTLQATPKQLRISDSDFEFAVSELLEGDSNFKTSDSEFKDGVTSANDVRLFVTSYATPAIPIL